MYLSLDAYKHLIIWISLSLSLNSFLVDSQGAIFLLNFVEIVQQREGRDKISRACVSGSVRGSHTPAFISSSPNHWSCPITRRTNLCLVSWKSREVKAEQSPWQPCTHAPCWLGWQGTRGSLEGAHVRLTGTPAPVPANESKGFRFSKCLLCKVKSEKAVFFVHRTCQNSKIRKTSHRLWNQLLPCSRHIFIHGELQKEFDKRHDLHTRPWQRWAHILGSPLWRRMVPAGLRNTKC